MLLLSFANTIICEYPCERKHLKAYVTVVAKTVKSIAASGQNDLGSHLGNKARALTCIYTVLQIKRGYRDNFGIKNHISP